LNLAPRVAPPRRPIAPAARKRNPRTLLPLLLPPKEETRPLSQLRLPRHLKLLLRRNLQHLLPTAPPEVEVAPRSTLAVALVPPVLEPQAPAQLDRALLALVPLDLAPPDLAAVLDLLEAAQALLDPAPPVLVRLALDLAPDLVQEAALVQDPLAQDLAVVRDRDRDLALVLVLAAVLVLEAALALVLDLAAVLVRVLTPLLKLTLAFCEFTLVNKQIKG